MTIVRTAERHARRASEVGTLVRSLAALSARFAIAIALCASPVAQGADGESLVKAAFLYNFAKFVRWPDAVHGETFSLCVLGVNPLGDALESLRDKQVRGRAIDVRSISDADGPARCHLVYISASESDRLGELLPMLNERHVLSVSDIRDFASRGGVIGLLKVDNKIRFEINIASAEAAGLSISSNLLSLAQAVHTTRPNTDT